MAAEEGEDADNLCVLFLPIELRVTAILHAIGSCYTTHNEWRTDSTKHGIQTKKAAYFAAVSPQRSKRRKPNALPSQPNT